MWGAIRERNVVRDGIERSSVALVNRDVMLRKRMGGNVVRQVRCVGVGMEDKVRYYKRGALST